jgi:hypothetical protein
VDSSREHLNAERERADALDPRSQQAEETTAEVRDGNTPRTGQSRTVG